MEIGKEENNLVEWKKFFKKNFFLNFVEFSSKLFYVFFVKVRKENV